MIRCLALLLAIVSVSAIASVSSGECEPCRAAVLDDAKRYCYHSANPEQCIALVYAVRSSVFCADECIGYCS